jgi:tetratricopeptide (TPR) repeat protein
MKFPISLLVCLILTASIFAQSETEKGIELYRKGNLDEAVTILQKVVDADNNDREAWIYLGIGLAKKGKDKEALKAFQNAASLRPLKAPPDDLKIISKRRCFYTDLARTHQVTGRVKLAIEFGDDAKIKFIFPIKGLPDGLTESCIQAAQQIVFEPAVINGKAVSSVKIVEYVFTLY